jgi:hypothetical protein
VSNNTFPTRALILLFFIAPNTKKDTKKDRNKLSLRVIQKLFQFHFFSLGDHRFYLIFSIIIKLGLLTVINVDNSSHRISNLGKRFSWQVNGWWASGTVIHNLHGHTVILARMWYSVSGPCASNGVEFATCSTTFPYGVSGCRDHHPIVLVAIACRSCQKKKTWPLDWVSVATRSTYLSKRNARIFF